MYNLVHLATSPGSRDARRRRVRVPAPAITPDLRLVTAEPQAVRPHRPERPARGAPPPASAPTGGG